MLLFPVQLQLWTQLSVALGDTEWGLRLILYQKGWIWGWIITWQLKKQMKVWIHQGRRYKGIGTRGQSQTVTMSHQDFRLVWVHVLMCPQHWKCLWHFKIKKYNSHKYNVNKFKYNWLLLLHIMQINLNITDFSCFQPTQMMKRETWGQSVWGKRDYIHLEKMEGKGFLHWGMCWGLTPYNRKSFLLLVQSTHSLDSRSEAHHRWPKWRKAHPQTT